MKNTRSALAMFAPGLGAALFATAAYWLWGAPLAVVAAAAVGAIAAEFVVAPSPRQTAHKRQAPAVSASAGLPMGTEQRLLEKLPMGVLLIDAEMCLQFSNGAATEILGRRPPDGSHCSALRVPRLLEAIDASLQGGLSSTLDISVLRGTEVYLSAHVRPLASTAVPSESPRQPAVMVVIEDVTAARRAEALHRDFIANASHELKTPLTAIVNAVETLQGHARDDPAAAERFLALMAAQAERMRRLVADLLSLNRIELNERIVPREPHRLVDILGEVSDAMRPIARTAGMHLTITLPPESVVVPGSFEDLSAAFTNLIENALRYGRQGGRVEIVCLSDVKERPNAIGVAVRDDGPGIAREDLPRLTERFYRVSVSRSRAQGGTGLGLAIVKHVVSRHRGKLEIDSVLGQGSCFTIWLPRLAVSAAVVAAEERQIAAACDRACEDTPSDQPAS
ncbi:MAG: ATP-binding protein [Pseudomonadota bacterium]